MSAQEQEWFEGRDKASFAQAARKAVENAEKAYDERRLPHPTEYDIQLRVTAEGVLSDYIVLASPRS